MDLPAFADPQIGAQASAPLQSIDLRKEWLPAMQLALKNNIKQLSGVHVCPAGIQFSYLDSFGYPVQMGWCQGDILPSLIETDRFVAILNRGQKI